jgi:hypothetical protein
MLIEAGSHEQQWLLAFGPDAHVKVVEMYLLESLAGMCPSRCGSLTPAGMPAWNHSHCDFSSNASIWASVRQTALEKLHMLHLHLNIENARDTSIVKHLYVITAFKYCLNMKLPPTRQESVWSQDRVHMNCSLTATGNMDKAIPGI